MNFKLLAAIPLDVQPQLQWLLYLEQSGAFVTGDDRKAFSVAFAEPFEAAPLVPARPFENRIPPAHPCNLPISLSLQSELAAQSWHGFKFLEPLAYDGGAEGDQLRTLVFGPNYGHPLLHPASGVILGLRSGAMELFDRSPDGLKSVAKTRTRGSAALCFAAHPEQMLVVYGDNAGVFHAHRFEPTGFGKANKIADKQRNASRVEFAQAGYVLVIGGMGYLSTYSFAGGKFAPLHDISIPVRDFIVMDDGKMILVNQGWHGIAAYRYDESGFAKFATLEPPTAVRKIVVSLDGRYLAVTSDDSPSLAIYGVQL